VRRHGHVGDLLPVALEETSFSSSWLPGKPAAIQRLVAPLNQKATRGQKSFPSPFAYFASVWTALLLAGVMQ
jgi:hypothetical protein